MGLLSSVYKAATKSKSKPVSKGTKLKERSKDVVRKRVGEEAADLGTPANVATPGSGQELRAGGPGAHVPRKLRQGEVGQGQRENLKKKIKEVEKYEETKNSLTGVERSQYIYKNSEKIKKLKKNIHDMKKRGIVAARKKGGSIVKKAGGGMTRQGLYPAEMARAGTMSQAKRKRYMKKGGKITYRMTGGQVVDHGYD